MCFSTGVSFGTGVLLAGLGAVSLKKARHPSQLLFASFPLIFAAQQITEGFVWLSLTHPAFAGWQKPGAVLFLFFARVVWPIAVPLGMLFLEKGRTRKKILRILSFIGIAVSSLLGWFILTAPLTAILSEHHIQYKVSGAIESPGPGSIFYIAATVLPLFISSVKKMWMLGTAIFISFLFSILYFEDYFVSVWCYFAAVISLIVLVIMQSLNRSEIKQNPPPS